jgi:phospholipid/cholesterol/gamma-HCH transport system ATP-binding protein
MTHVASVAEKPILERSTGPVIAFEDVRLGFAEGEVLRGFSFQVDLHETKVLIGESGTGKSLTMKLGAGLLHPDSGRVLFSGQDLGEMSEHDLLDFRRRVGFVFQEGALFDSLSVSENVAYRLREENEPEDEIQARVHEVLQLVEMGNAIDKMPSELSGGMRRRVSIARALASKPDVVFYDSPTAGLDPVTSQTIITLLLRLRDTQGVTALLATHRLQDAFGMANYRFDGASNRVIALTQVEKARNHFGGITFLFLREGKVYFEGGPQDVLDSADPYIKEFLV